MKEAQQLDGVKRNTYLHTDQRRTWRRFVKPGVIKKRKKRKGNSLKHQHKMDLSAIYLLPPTLDCPFKLKVSDWDSNLKGSSMAHFFLSNKVFRNPTRQFLCNPAQQ